ncbi:MULTISPECIES: sugar phosphate isomerase/epimerase family protein [unclassified Streptomyces]|uniref:sugar phosphate isomerase/epimerase family protein n=1 Tax=unclassified Streptomyces TaxID=2593676 RepID=UPI002E2D6644|nr:TIM barrel protein [Streptomyces sp. NBC_00223]
MCGPAQGIDEGDWPAAFDLAGELGLSGVLFTTARSVSPSLDRAELGAARRAAEERGLFIEIGVGCLGPDGDTAERVAELTAQIDAAVALGCDRFFGYTRTRRQGASPSHGEQLREIQRTLAALRPVLLERGCRLNVKTHEDLSSAEVVRLVETAGTDVFGIGLDVANLVVRAEDPVEVTRRLAPYVHQTHLEDVALYFAAAGLRRELRACGDGVLDWTAILRTLVHDAPARHLVFEQHRGQFDAGIFQDGWFDAEPQVRPRELADLVRSAVRCEQAAAEARDAGPADSPSEEGSTPRAAPFSRTDAAGRRAELRRSIAHVRSVLATISGEQP